ncbi:MAG: EthD domain-containing protein [Proteobacteria bacterium]|nr:EthD domain-containing protein [Pseudomonadota bacterium]
MYKVSFLLAPGAGQPFSLQGDAAGEAATGIFPGLCGYVQTAAVPGQENPAFSGVIECFFSRASDALAAVDADPSALLSDDVSILSVVVGMERVVMRTPACFGTDQVKGVYPFRRKQGMSVADFQDYWWHSHGPIAARTEEALSYIQVHPLPECYAGGDADYDGITEIAWPDMEAAMRGVTSRQMQEDQSTDAGNFVDRESVSLFFAKAEVIIAP